jgi:hypothetical protein
MTDEERLKEAKRIRGVVKEALLLDGFLEGLTPEEAEAMVEKGYQGMAKTLDEVKYAVKMCGNKLRKVVIKGKDGEPVEVFDMEQIRYPA